MNCKFSIAVSFDFECFFPDGIENVNCSRFSLQYFKTCTGFYLDFLSRVCQMKAKMPKKTLSLRDKT